MILLTPEERLITIAIHLIITFMFYRIARGYWIHSEYLYHTSILKGFAYSLMFMLAASISFLEFYQASYVFFGPLYNNDLIENVLIGFFQLLMLWYNRDSWNGLLKLFIESGIIMGIIWTTVIFVVVVFIMFTLYRITYYAFGDMYWSFF